MCNLCVIQTDFYIQTLHNDCSHIEDVHRRCRSRADFGLVLIRLSRVVEIFIFLTAAPVVSALEDRYNLQCHLKHDILCDRICRHVRSCMTSKCKKSVMFQSCM